MGMLVGWHQSRAGCQGGNSSLAARLRGRGAITPTGLEWPASLVGKAGGGAALLPPWTFPQPGLRQVKLPGALLEGRAGPLEP